MQGSYDALVQDLRQYIAKTDPGLAKALRLADAGHGSAPRQHQPGDLSSNLSRLEQAGEQLKATDTALRKAMAPLLPSRAEQIERARSAREEMMTKALRQFEAGEITAHDVSAAEIGSSDLLEKFIAGLPR
jgi:hypothetical protein